MFHLRKSTTITKSICSSKTIYERQTYLTVLKLDLLEKNTQGYFLILHPGICVTGRSGASMLAKQGSGAQGDWQVIS
jgi:hypothetical protein